MKLENYVSAIGVALAIKQISTHVRSRAHGKNIGIAGIGTAVYSFLVVTCSTASCRSRRE